MTISRSMEEAQRALETRGREAVMRVSRTAERRAREAVAFARRDPRKAALYAGGGLLATYAAWRVLVYPPPWLLGGVAELNGLRYRITNGDMLWLGRMVYGETAGGDEAKAAVLWSVVTRHMSKPTLYQGGSLTRTIRDFSQPVNPIWATPLGCRDGRGCCGTFWGACSLARLMRRFNVRWASWHQLPPDVRSAVERFVRGELPNPVPGANNFAMSVTSAARSASIQAGFSPVSIRSNVFVRDPGSTPGNVRIA